MGIRLNSSMPMFAMRQINRAQDAASVSMQRLASGSRINSATDDAAGLAIATGMTAKIQGYNQSIRNANDGISMLQTAEGTLGEVTNVIQRMRELTVQAGNDTNSQSNRKAISQEIGMLSESVSEILQKTQFNGMNLFGNAQKSFNIGIEGANLKLDIGGFSYQDLALTDQDSALDIDVSSNPAVTTSLKTLDQALLKVTDERSSYGAQQNRLGQTINHLSGMALNTESSRSRIMDTDYAAESAALAKNQLLMQASTSILVRFTQRHSETILSLLQSLK